MGKRRRWLIGLIILAAAFVTALVQLDDSAAALRMSGSGTVWLAACGYTGGLLDGVLRRSVRGLGDPYSVYMDQHKFADYMDETIGTFGGIGVELTEVDGAAVVVSTLTGGPAEAAGVMAGDRIRGIDGADGLGFAAVADGLMGPVGSTVAIAIDRGGTELAPIRLVRVLIQANPVTAERFESGIGYLAISAFNAHTVENLDRELAAFRAEGIKGMILDLRGNPGGLLEQGVAVAGRFVPAGAVVQIIQPNGKRETITAGTRAFGCPLVVLVDAGTASTAEIVAGAIQDRRAGIIMGTRTYGKGSIQTLYGLGRGRGLKITTASYLTPAGRIIEGIGITPDRIVVGMEAQIQAAVDLIEAESK